MAIKFVDKPPQTASQPTKKPVKAPVAPHSGEIGKIEADAPPAKRRGRPAKAATAKDGAKSAKAAKAKSKRG